MLNRLVQYITGAGGCHPTARCVERERRSLEEGSYEKVH